VNQLRFRPQGVRIEAEAPQPLKNGLLRCLGRGEHLGDPERRTVIEDQIREGAPRIHAEEAGWGIRACAIMI